MRQQGRYTPTNHSTVETGDKGIPKGEQHVAISQVDAAFKRICAGEPAAHHAHKKIKAPYFNPYYKGPPIV